jgi:hypothetical protein
MALNTVPPSPEMTNVLDTIQDASADLCVCDTLILAVEKFVDEIRGYSAPATILQPGIRPDEYVFGPALRAMTLIDEARDRLQDAKCKVNAAVDTLCKRTAA